VARLDLPRLGDPATVARAVAAVAERVGGLERVPVASLLSRARVVTLVRGAPPSADPRCEQAAAHAAGLMRAAAGGRDPLPADVIATRRACDKLGLADCLLAATTEAEAVSCAITRSTAGEPWAGVIEGLPDPEAAAVEVAAALSLRVRPDVPRYADGRWAVHALPGRLLVGQPGLVGALARAATGPADPVLLALARELPPQAPVQAVYRTLGTPPSLQAAALALSQDGGLSVTWRLQGGAALADELRQQLAALVVQAESQVGPWSAWLGAALPVPASDALQLVQAVPVLARSAVLSPRDGGVGVVARAPLDLAAILAHAAEGATVPASTSPLR
jgi:hypothetical protein